jgi:hypothetical protein
LGTPESTDPHSPIAYRHHRGYLPWEFQREDGGSCYFLLNLTGDTIAREIVIRDHARMTATVLVAFHGEEFLSAFLTLSKLILPGVRASSLVSDRTVDPKHLT